ncbi:NAD(P)/FAD-dependent oxidoreductase [Tahibacter harae]|uniref:FAD-dependent oxidoreductase n=1 Tax=Tahibacter harae TaxID=2963937 RepID=A0ABT1QLV7_9GAMM|nr:FAD-dependent oxidoreductase [Tahibacter harae]MCQ4163508.1 FAD-dependent oxidoreductase [Tahibacter harae]
MRIAVIGSGISGLACAYLLSRTHEVVLFEADERLGGHTDTHTVEQGGCVYRIDTGFIVHNAENYPLLSALFAELGVATQATTMSFSVHNAATGLEYNAASLSGLFCQRRNLLSPRFWGLLADLRRFYRSAGALLDAPGAGPTLGDYLAEHRYGTAFRDDHLVPMASALWSSPAQQILSFPARYLVQFMAHHRMLQVAGRPQWRVVCGGSQRYVQALQARWQATVRTATPVLGLRRDERGAEVVLPGGSERFDAAILACHSDQALALLRDADTREREILGAIAYQPNEVVLHTDARMLPRSRKAWAAWNAYVPAEPGAPCSVSYCMNLLQGVTSPLPFVVTLNRTEAIDPGAILARRRYAHPVYSHASVAAQARKAEIQGRRHTWFAGAYWGWGFHEDGMRSAVEVVRELGVNWNAAAANRAAA